MSISLATNALNSSRMLGNSRAIWPCKNNIFKEVSADD
jgi:hypothetical protein